VPTAFESKAAAEAVADEAVEAVQRFARTLDGAPEARRAALLDTVPGLIGYYSLGTAALAADFYDEQRQLASVASSYTAQAVILDRTVKIRRGVAWAADPLFTDDWDTSLARLAEVVSPETMRPYRDTILTNFRDDTEAVGWRRITSPGACGFCQLLAARGAVYKKETAYFAAHNSCKCTCAPVFRGGETGPEASVIQYMASKRRRTEAERAEIRKWVAAYEENPTYYSDLRSAGRI
jgi:hypothetical protein